MRVSSTSAAAILAHRHRLPPWADQALDAVQWRGRAPGTVDRDGAPPLPRRGRAAVLIGSTNFAGQGWQWARALERELPEVVAQCWTFSASERFGYPTDYGQPIAVNRMDAAWQRKQFDRVVELFDAVVIESGRPLFGSLHRFDPIAEAEALRAAGVRVAMLWHGTDIRIPSEHAVSHEASPFRPPTALTRVQEGLARRNRRRLARFDGPVLVSTPDLLPGLPGATWCPVVVDQAEWRTETQPLRGEVSVAHVPSNPQLKGSDLVDAALGDLEREGWLSYRRGVGLRREGVRELYRAADVVLDQFRLGIYGVAACEAMAAGRLVISDVDQQVRDLVRQLTGLDLPIVQASGEELPGRVGDVLRHPDTYRATAADGPTFVSAVHDGRRSAAALAETLDLPPAPTRDPGQTVPPATS